MRGARYGPAVSAKCTPSGARTVTPSTTCWYEPFGQTMAFRSRTVAPVRRATCRTILL